jgi:hypothetical protein
VCDNAVTLIGSFHLLYLVLLEYINHLLESLGEQDIQNSAKEALNKYMTTPSLTTNIPFYIMSSLYPCLSSC